MLIKTYFFYLFAGLWYNINMKKVIFIIAVATLSFSCGTNTKYTIIGGDGRQYGADFYNKTGDCCIQFNDLGCGCGGEEDGPGKPTMLCGSYSIVEN
jgi:hypothetical protein